MQEKVLYKIKKNSEIIDRFEEFIDGLRDDFWIDNDLVLELASKNMEFRDEQEQLGIIYKRLKETNNN